MDLINYIYSPNGTSKTNVLEAVQALSIGKSLRAKSENEIVPLFSQDTINKSLGVYINGVFTDEELTFSQTYFLEIVKDLSAENIETKQKKRKTLLVNKTKTSLNEYIGRVPSIWFSPENIKVINSSPRNKRKYFDDILIQLYPEYLFDLRNYEKSPKHRNRLLQQINNGVSQTQSLRIWTEQLIKYGAKIIKVRQSFFDILNQNFKHLDNISRYKFNIEFQPNIVTNAIFDEDAEFTFRERLRKTYELDKARQTTNSGPHKDDWHILIKINEQTNFIRADKFASRGQQRMSLIILQIVLINLFQKNLDKKPILLLDDIFSELDEENERILVDYIIKENIQSIITGVDKKDFENMKEYDLRELI